MPRYLTRMWIRLFSATLGLLGAAAAAGADSGSTAALRDYHSANGLLNRGLHELAISEYRRFLDAHGEHDKAPTARYGLAVCLYRLERYDEATEELLQLRRLLLNLSNSEHFASNFLVLKNCLIWRIKV